MDHTWAALTLSSPPPKLKSEQNSGERVKIEGATHKTEGEGKEKGEEEICKKRSPKKVTHFSSNNGKMLSKVISYLVKNNDFLV